MQKLLSELKKQDSQQKKESSCRNQKLENRQVSANKLQTSKPRGFTFSKTGTKKQAKFITGICFLFIIYCMVTWSFFWLILPTSASFLRQLMMRFPSTRSLRLAILPSSTLLPGLTQAGPPPPHCCQVSSRFPGQFEKKQY